MKATSIVYHKVFSLPNFQNEKIGIEIELSEEDDATSVLNKAREWCENMHSEKRKITDAEYNNAKVIVNNPDDYTGKQVKDAKALIEKYNKAQELPF